MSITTGSSGAMARLAVDGGQPALQGGSPTWPVYDQAEADALLDVLNSGRWGSTTGDVVATFEREFAHAHRAAHGICLSNGTLAIAAALRAAGVGLGDEVIVPPYTFIATASAALFVGAIPVFADVDPRTHLIDPAAVEAAITPRTRAVIGVHLAGRPMDMDALSAITDAHDLVLIEDSAQATGAAYRGRPVGAIGAMGTFSFQSSKNITAGEGGIVLTDDDKLADALYSLVNVGRVRGGGWYAHESVGYNLRLTEFQAAILRVQLTRHPELQRIRERNARQLTELLADVEGVLLPPEDASITTHGRHLFLLRVPAWADGGADSPDRRATALKALAAEGVTASSGYVPLHRNEPLLREIDDIERRLGNDARPDRTQSCPNADNVSVDTIWLPQPYLLGDEEFTAGVANAITKVVTASPTG